MHKKKISQLLAYKRVSLPSPTHCLSKRGFSMSKQTNVRTTLLCKKKSTGKSNELAQKNEQKTTHSSESTLLKTLSLNKCRERVRRERVLLLKRSVSIKPKGYGGDKEGLRDALLCLTKTSLRFAKKQNFVAQQSFLQSTYTPVLTTNLVNTHSKRVDTLPPLQLKRNKSSRGVWRGFTNTFMRNGAKLRYQTVLRKTLLAL